MNKIKVLVEYDLDSGTYHIPVSQMTFYDAVVPPEHVELKPESDHSETIVKLVGLGVSPDEIIKLRATGLL